VHGSHRYEVKNEEVGDTILDLTTS